jgi:hypothetical protein
MAKMTPVLYSRSRSARGSLDSTPSSLIRENAGDSRMRSRIKRPTAIRTMLRRNGTLQPQEKNCSSGSEEKALNTAVESISPAGEPVCGQLA